MVMGVLNVTPDSFSDGGAFIDPHDALARAAHLLADGADLIDVGAESTRPGSERVSGDDQIARLEPILAPLCRQAGDHNALVSVDTTCAAVAEFALDRGAAIINDVSAGRDDGDLLPLAASRDAPVILMHMLGEPKTMQAEPEYDDVVAEVRDFLAERLDAAAAAGVPREHCILDPGIGFGKQLEHNLALIAHLDELAEPPTPLLLGPSRKRFIGEIYAAATGKDAPPPHERLGGTLAACLVGRTRGASIFRVHNVSAMIQALAVVDALDTARPR
jgi:dihydropteroate synthase